MGTLIAIEREKRDTIQDFATSAKKFFEDMLALKQEEVAAAKAYYSLKSEQIKLSNMLG